MRPEPVTLHGPRLRLRPWREEDRPAFAAMNADPAVMRHFPATLDRAKSDEVMDRISGHFTRHGYGFWALERHDQPGLLGFCGLAQVPWDPLPWSSSTKPPVEIGWRLAAAHQRQGYAEEAARIALAHGFGPLNLQDIVAFTVPGNDRSLGLMKRLGMQQAGSFDHPRLPEGHSLRRHLLYRLSRGAWIETVLGG